MCSRDVLRRGLRVRGRRTSLSHGTPSLHSHHTASFRPTWRCRCRARALPSSIAVRLRVAACTAPRSDGGTRHCAAHGPRSGKHTEGGAQLQRTGCDAAPSLTAGGCGVPSSEWGESPFLQLAMFCCCRCGRVHWRRRGQAAAIPCEQRRSERMVQGALSPPTTAQLRHPAAYGRHGRHRRKQPSGTPTLNSSNEAVSIATPPGHCRFRNCHSAFRLVSLERCSLRLYESTVRLLACAPRRAPTCVRNEERGSAAVLSHLFQEAQCTVWGGGDSST